MHSSSKIFDLPEKVVKRIYTLLITLIPELESAVIEHQRALDNELSTWMRQRRELGSRDRRILSQTLFRHFRWLGWTRQTLKLELADALYVAARLEESASTLWSDHLAAHRQIAPVLEPLGTHSLEEKKEALETAFNHACSLEELLPKAAIELTNPNLLSHVQAPFQQRPSTWLRTRVDAQTIATELSAAKIPSSAHPRLDRALAIEGGIHLAQQIPDHIGQVVVQDAASQCVSHIAAPQPGEHWWDACCGSGGKTLHMADLMQQEGKLDASDPRREALIELKKRTRRHGIKMISADLYDPIKQGPRALLYDGVLVDAPCSGWGTWGRNPDARWRTSPASVQKAAKKQLALLEHTAPSVKPGGLLVYAVCTLTLPETHEVMAQFLTRHPEFTLCPFAHPMSGERVNGTLQINPENHDGMFIAKCSRDHSIH
jgi:16S rRNA (cytosine967-C5)-methyltransferase